MALSTSDIISIIIVSLFWGCTNPLLRLAETTSSSESLKDKKDTILKNTNSNNNHDDSDSTAAVFSLVKLKSRLLNIKLYIPYLLNQFGSLVFYWLLGSSQLTMIVPLCNALATVFSCITSFVFVGERVDKPWRALVGVVFVSCGVSICMMSSSNNDSKDEDSNELLITNEL